MPYLSQDALHGLSKYSYKGVDKSLLSKYFLNPIWNQFVKLWPLTVAPNTITLLGLSIVLLNVSTLLYYDPGYSIGKSDQTLLPQWVFYTWGVGLLLYQAMDAIDGKQARRTGMASPLGEMFDHGCDAINTTLEAILGCYALNLGQSNWTIASQITSLATFYLATWEEYYTGELYLGYISGPVEGIVLISLVFFVSGYAGPQIWSTTIAHVIGIDEHSNDWIDTALNYKLNEAFMIVGGVGLAFNIVTSWMNVLSSRRATKKSMLSPFLNLMPCVVTTLLNILWLASPSLSKSTIVNSDLIVPFMFTWGLQFAHQVGQMILAHVTSQPLPRFQMIWIWTTVAILDAHSELIFGTSPVFQASQHDFKVVIYTTLIITFVNYATFVTGVIQELTSHLGIACFTVRKKDSSGHWELTSEAAKSKQ